MIELDNLNNPLYYLHSSNKNKYIVKIWQKMTELVPS